MSTTLDKLITDLEAAIQFELDGLHSGKLTPTEFEVGMAQTLLTFHTAAYMDGLDADALTTAQARIVASVVGEQVDYLNAFADDIEAGSLSEDAITARALSYSGAIQSLWWQGATDGEDLPFHPGDGGTECLGNCRCELEQQEPGVWIWKAEPNCCSGCADRAAGSPYYTSAWQTGEA